MSMLVTLIDDEFSLVNISTYILYPFLEEQQLYDDTQNYLFIRLHLVVETFGHSTQRINHSNFNSIKVPKVVKPTNKKTLSSNFRD